MTLQEMLDLLDESKTETEKVASSSEHSDEVASLIDTLKSDMTQNKTSEQLVKNASVAADAFSKVVVQNIESALATDAYVEKVAQAVSDMILYKLAVESSDQVVNSYSDPVPDMNPRDHTEEESKKEDPKALAANAKIQALMDRETTVSGQAEGSTGPIKSASAEDLEAVLAYLQEVL